MTEVLQTLSDNTLNDAHKGLSALYSELMLNLGAERLNSDIYSKVLDLYIKIDDESIRRKKIETVKTSGHNLDYDYKDNVIII